MDEAWRAKGHREPQGDVRGPTGHYLAHLGVRDAVGLFEKAGTMGA
jgi:hypothetical protein